MITKGTKRALRKLLSKDYPTADDVKQIADDIDLSIDDIDVNANIITVWSKLLDRASEDKAKWNELIDVCKDVTDGAAIDAILSNNSSTDDSNTDVDSGADENSEDGVSKSIGGIKKPDAVTPKKKPVYKNHLLVIGINNYSNGIPALNNAFPDAERFYKVLTDKYQFDVNSDTCTFLQNENASRKNIMDTFQGLTRSLGEDDNLIFYFSGHGELDKVTDIGYWLPADAKSGDTSTYISNDTIKGYLKGMKVQHVVGIIDACFSGSMVLRSDVEVAERYYNIPSRWVMTSGVEEAVPDGSPGRNSPFAKSLLAHLENNTEDVLGLSKLWLKFREGVIANSSQTPLCQPVQNIGHLGGEYFFLMKDAKLDSIPKSSPQIDLTISRSIVTKETELDGFRNQIRTLVATNEMDEVFEVLSTKLDNNSRHYTTVLVNQGGYNRNKTDKRNGTLTQEHYTLSLNRTRFNLLSVINDLDEDDLT